MSLDPDELGRRASRAAQGWSPGVTLSDVRPLAGGTSSLTYIADVIGGPVERLVLKAAFPGAPPIKNRDVLRQARALRALGSAAGVAVPQVLFEDAGAPVEIPPFFAMSFVAGESFEPNLDAEDPGTPASVITGRALSAARMLAALHAVDTAAVGAEAVIDPLAEVDRWVKTFATVAPDLQGNAFELADSLRLHPPSPAPPSLVHGDWRLGNLLCVGEEVRAAIDWEIWAVSDPRIDLSWFLLTGDAALHPTSVRHHVGMPDSSVLLAEYQRAAGTANIDLLWFRALTLFKMGAVAALIAKHRRKVGDSYGEIAAGHVPVMLERAGALLA